MKPIEALSSDRAAACLLAHPLRTRILALAREPISASDLARRLGLPRQRVNYHVRQLADARFLRPAGEAAKGNMIERQYQASAQAYVLNPAVLNEVAVSAESAGQAGPGQLAALCARSLADVIAVAASAEEANVRPRVLAMLEDLHFESAADRTAFLDDLAATVTDLIEQYRAAEPTARPFRVLVAAYPPIAD